MPPGKDEGICVLENGEEKKRQEAKNKNATLGGTAKSEL